MVQSDALSRRPDHMPEEDHDNEDVVLLPDTLFVNLLDMDLQQRIANATDFDFDVAKAVEALLDNGPVTLRNDLEDWKMEEKDGRRILFYKGKNYIPQDTGL